MPRSVSSFAATMRSHLALAVAATVVLAAAIVAILVFVVGSQGPSLGATRTVLRGDWATLENPINPAEQLDVPWGTRSDYLQPWRAYLDTQPASAMRAALGINFDLPASEADAAAGLLGDVGFVRARLEIPWSAMSYADPGRLVHPGYWATILRALEANAIRPLILLNANSGAPGPTQQSTVHVTVPAQAGSTVIQLSPSSVSGLVPGRSGFRGADGTAAEYLVTAVSKGGLVHISQPLARAVAPGDYTVTTLRYAPFTPPFNRGGGRNPMFDQTLAGWLLYVKGVTDEVRRVLGNDQFDIEIWNETIFGSRFLNISDYYDPVPAPFRGTGSVVNQLLLRTVDWIRDPANHLPNVEVADGFASDDGRVSGATVPAGVSAISRHPYYVDTTMPGYAGSIPQVRQVNALGGQESSTKHDGGYITWPFVPSYRMFFPESSLTAVIPDGIVRDLSPYQTTVGGVPHGRDTAPAGQSAPPRTWVTEMGFRADQNNDMTPAQTEHVQAKAILRTVAAFVGLGVTNVDIFAAGDGSWSIIDPGELDGGPTLVALSRFMAAFTGPATFGDRRSLTLDAIASETDTSQFYGDGSAAHPNLYNRDVVAFFPFQTSSHAFVVPVYVMTRALDRPYDGDPASVDYFDLPPEAYRLTVGGLDASDLSVSATDPLTGTSVPVQVISHTRASAVIQLPLTDSVRLLEIHD